MCARLGWFKFDKYATLHDAVVYRLFYLSRVAVHAQLTAIFYSVADAIPLALRMVWSLDWIKSSEPCHHDHHLLQLRNCLVIPQKS